MLVLAKKKEVAAACVGGGVERRAEPGVPGVVGAIGWQAGCWRPAGGAGAGGRVDELPGRTGPHHAGVEGSAGIFGGRDCGADGDQREHGEGEAVPCAAADYGAGETQTGSKRIGGATKYRRTGIGKKTR